MAPALRRYQLFTFFVLAFAIAWPLQAAFLARGSGLTRQLHLLVLLLLISWAPAVAALVVLAVIRDPQESRALRRRLAGWRVGGRWYLYACVLPPLAWLAAIAVARPFGVHLAFQPAFLAILPGILVANFGEELGWRGFALPRLLSRTNAVYAGLVLGVIWGAWHLGSPASWPSLTAGLIATQIGTLTALSVILTWIFVNSGGSLILATLGHAAFDASAFAFPAAAASDQIRVILTLLLGIGAVGLMVRYGMRLSRTPAAGAR